MNAPKVLLVDDVPSNLRTLAEILKDEYQIFMATNGRNAISATEINEIDLVLLDVVMPEMDGYEVCKSLKSQRRTSEIPVIFITSKTEPDDELKGLEIGAVDYITKPYNPSIVRMRLKNHIELKKSRDLLRKLSDIDGLTGIPNRRRFDEYLEQSWYAAIRSKSFLSLILMDVDFFKLYNDNYGHASGDACLKQVAGALTNSKKRHSDLMARYGGEEFVCVLPDTDLTGATAVGEMIRKKVASLNISHAHSSVADYVTLSLGAVSMIPSLDFHPEDMIKAADQNLYKAKKNGRNRLAGQLFHPESFKILLVEDDECMMDVYESNIEIWKIPAKVFKARNGVEGLIQVGKERPDIIVTDLLMPELDGIKMITRMNEIKELKGINIVVVTALSDEAIAQKGGLPERVKVFKKPVQLEDLKEHLLSLVSSAIQITTCQVVSCS